MSPKEHPSEVELEDGEFVTRKIKALKVDKSVSKQVLFKGTLEKASGTWYVTNRRLIYEGKKAGKKSMAGYVLGGVLGFALGMDKDIVTVRHEQIIDLDIIPYAKIDEVLEVKYRENGHIKSIYIGLPMYQRLKLNLKTLKEYLERAPNITSFCASCGAPMTKDETFCPQCGARRE